MSASPAARLDRANEVSLSPAPAADLLPLADLNIWAVTQATPKPFIMPGFIPSGELTLLTGAGGANKSTFGHQLATCCAAGVSMLGREVQQCSALYITCEDDEGRLHWVQEGICRALGLHLSDLTGKLHLSSLRGRLGNVLGAFDVEGILHPLGTFHSLKATLIKTGARLLVLDNAAHLFGGNENDRQQVTQFVNLLYSLCLDLGVTVILVAHSNKAGDSYSGSTAWLNAVRSQIFIGRPEDSHDPDERVATLGKANYARQGEELRFRWHDFALIRDDDLPEDRRGELAATAQAAEENAVFLRCLAERNRQRRQVSEKPTAQNYAPKQFEKMPEAKGIKRARLEMAMDRLFRLNQIERGFLWRDSGEGKDIIGLREVTDRKPESSPETCRKHLPETSGNPHNMTGNTPPIYNISGAASEAAAPTDMEVQSSVRPVDFSKWERRGD